MMVRFTSAAPLAASIPSGAMHVSVNNNEKEWPHASFQEDPHAGTLRIGGDLPGGATVRTPGCLGQLCPELPEHPERKRRACGAGRAPHPGVHVPRRR